MSPHELALLILLQPLRLDAHAAPASTARFPRERRAGRGRNINGFKRRDTALALLRRHPQEAIVIPVQVHGELFNVLLRKGGKSRNQARDALLSWRDTFLVFETSPEVMLAASDLALDHQLGIWDAVILSAASQSVAVSFFRGTRTIGSPGRGDGGQSVLLATAYPAASSLEWRSNDRHGQTRPGIKVGASAIIESPALVAWARRSAFLAKLSSAIPWDLAGRC